MQYVTEFFLLIAFFNDLVLSYIASVIAEWWVWSIDGVMLTIENPNTPSEKLPSAPVHHKSHMDWHGVKPMSPRWKVCDQPSEPKQGPLLSWLIDKLVAYPCNKNQLDAQFILSLFCQSTSTCFGHICSPSSGGILYIYIYIYIYTHTHTHIHTHTTFGTCCAF